MVYSDSQPIPTIFDNTSSQGLSSDSSEGVDHMRICAGGQWQESKIAILGGLANRRPGKFKPYLHPKTKNLEKLGYK